MDIDRRTSEVVFGDVFDAVLGELQLPVVMGLGILEKIDITQVLHFLKTEGC
jgi:hypothetical protein